MFVIGDDTANRNLILLEFTCVLFWKTSRVLTSVRRSLRWFDIIYRKEWWIKYIMIFIRLAIIWVTLKIRQIIYHQLNSYLHFKASFCHCFPAHNIYIHIEFYFLLGYLRHLHASNVLPLQLFTQQIRVKSKHDGGCCIECWASHYFAHYHKNKQAKYSHTIR